MDLRDLLHQHLSHSNTKLRQAGRKGNCSRSVVTYIYIYISHDAICISHRINTEETLILKSIFESKKTCRVAYEYASGLKDHFAVPN